MRKKHLIAGLGALWVAMMVYLLSGATHLGTSYAEKANQQRLHNAVWAAAANYDGMRDAGYIRWTPTVIAGELVKVLNASTLLAPEEKAELGATARFAAPPTQFVLDRPTAPWQVAVVADEQRRRVRIEGYGKNLDEPLIVKELVVEGY